MMQGPPAALAVTPSRPRSTRTVHSCDEGIRQRLRDARVAAEIPQRQLAFRGCSAAYLSRIEGGERWPSLQVIEELAERLGVNAAWLAWGKGPREHYEPRTDVRVLIARLERELGGDEEEDAIVDALEDEVVDALEDEVVVGPAIERLREWAAVA